jgi:hypothetical protein
MMGQGAVSGVSGTMPDRMVGHTGTADIAHNRNRAPSAALTR